MRYSPTNPLLVSAMAYFPKAALVILLAAAVGACATGGGVADSDPTKQQGDVDFHLLLAEIARERGQYQEAARHYRDAAMLSSDPTIAERAATMAESTGQTEIGLQAANRWLKLAPDDVRVYRFLGTFELRSQHYGKAAGHFDRLAAEAADLDSGLDLVVSLLGTEEDRVGATEVMRELVKRHSDSAQGHYGLGRLALRAGANELALEHAQAAVQLRPDSVDKQLLLARALLVNRQVDEGLALAASIAEHNDAAEIRLEYAELLLAARRTDQARTLLNDVLTEVPGMPEAVRALAFLELSAGELEAARRRFDELKLGQRYRNEAFYYLGRISETEDQYLQAVRYYSRVTEGSSAVEAQLRASQLLYEQLSDADGALRHLEDFGQANPRLATPMLLGRGRLLVLMERNDEAMTLLTTARETDPGNESLADAQAQLYMFTAQQALGRENLEVAEVLLNQGLDIRPKDTTLRYSKALLLERTDRLRDAIGLLKDLVNERPDDSLALNALGYTLADRTERYDEARRYVQRALVIEPNNPAILDSMGWVLFKLGEYDAALTFLQRALTMQRDPEIGAHLIHVHIAMDQRQEAESLLQELLAENPEDPVLQPLKDSLTR
jgi:tetratricopeptide (TPR) repeat protein